MAVRLGGNNARHSLLPAQTGQPARPGRPNLPAPSAPWRVPSLLHPLVIATLLAFAASLWSAGGALAQERQDLPPELEVRAHSLYKQVMCPTCIGQTIDQSRAPIAANMRGIVRERLLAGDSDEEILARFVEAYGESVLASPPRDGVGLAAWLVPPVALVFGGLAVFMAVQALRRPLPEPAVSPAWGSASAASGEGLDSYLRLVDQELEGSDESPGGAPDERT